MTIQELIDELERVPSDKRHLPIYAFNDAACVGLLKPTLFNADEPHGVDNPLSMTLDGELV